MSSDQSAESYWIRRFDQWWNRARGGSEHPGYLRAAFRAVLSRLSEADLTAFLRYDPAVVCLEGCMAQVSCQYIPQEWLRDGREPRIHTIHFVIDLIRQTQAALLFLVAHEVAHVVLEHLDNCENPRDQREAEVATKVTEWDISKPESFYTLDPDLRLLHLTDSLDEIVADLELSCEDDTWAGIEGWVVPRLRRVIESQRDLLRPGQLARLCAPSTTAVSEAHREALALRDRAGRTPHVRISDLSDRNTVGR